MSQLARWARIRLGTPAKNAPHPIREIANPRQGAAAIELALCLPVLLFVFLASVEAADMIFLDHSLNIAAYEGARAAAHEAQTVQEVTDKCQQILDERNIQDTSITVTPSNLAELAPGTHIEVGISAPCDSNSNLNMGFYSGLTFSSNVTVVRE